MPRSPQPAQVRTWAAARLMELDQERAALLQLFPGLGTGRGSRRPAADADQPASAGRGRARRRRGNMSAAARRAVSLRMKRYWAERRKAKGAKNG